jgi:hypothetical protein
MKPSMRRQGEASLLGVLCDLGIGRFFLTMTEQ